MRGRKRPRELRRAPPPAYLSARATCRGISTPHSSRVRSRPSPPPRVSRWMSWRWRGGAPPTRAGACLGTIQGCHPSGSRRRSRWYCRPSSCRRRCGGDWRRPRPTSPYSSTIPASTSLSPSTSGTPTQSARTSITSPPTSGSGTAHGHPTSSPTATRSWPCTPQRHITSALRGGSGSSLSAIPSWTRSAGSRGGRRPAAPSGARMARWW
mmetsp:Transcript_31083/g.99257  ORF Transcript_31083/g.99257 Transcript_31083/m.99257 type:complete len:210 (-) Transcript_31083:651-1280(-)